ncbi:hypothetical protein [Nitrosovibrio sp. Nv4]|nr:hypothetical protein [Nitrosovibrio sp. Nv4]
MSAKSRLNPTNPRKYSRDVDAAPIIAEFVGAQAAGLLAAMDR